MQPTNPPPSVFHESFLSSVPSPYINLTYSSVSKSNVPWQPPSLLHESCPPPLPLPLRPPLATCQIWLCCSSCPLRRLLLESLPKFLQRYTCSPDIGGFNCVIFKRDIIVIWPSEINGNNTLVSSMKCFGFFCTMD